VKPRAVRVAVLPKDKGVMNTSAHALLEEEIKAAFVQTDEGEARIAFLLSLLPLKPIQGMLLRNYKVWTSDGRLKFPPMAVVRAMLLKELTGIRSCQQLIAYLFANPEEGGLLGFGRFLPSTQTFSIMKRERIDVEVRQAMDFVVDGIRQLAHETGRQFDVEFIRAGSRKGGSKRTIQRHVSMHGSKVTRYMKRAILPMLKLPESDRQLYKNGDLLNSLGFMAERHICANQGCGLMREDERFKGRAPHGRTLLGRFAKLDAPEVRQASFQFYDTTFHLGKRHGLIPSHPVVLALDYTDIPYYGDSNVQMVVAGKPDKGTCHKHRHVAIKISEKWGDLFLLGLPIGVFTDEREAVKTLIQFAKQRVSINHIIVDKGFFSTKYISLFEEMGVRYLMPGVKNPRIMRLIQEGKESAEITMKSQNKKHVAHVKLAFRKAPGGDVVCFATNLPPEMTSGGDLFTLYSRRWNVETGFRVIKHEFMAKTTSKRYKIRFLFFSFSLLLYNVWVIVNAALNRFLYGKQEGAKVMSAKMFMIKFYEAYVHYEPPPGDM
jgi:hypothetical protein